MLKAKSNYGVQLKIGDGQSPEQFVDVTGVRLVPSIEIEQEDIEVTHHGSGKYREYIPSGLSETGELAIELISVYPDAVQDRLRAGYKSGEVFNFQVLYPNGLGKQFSAYIKNIVLNDADATSPEAMIETVTLKLTGDIADKNNPALGG